MFEIFKSYRQKYYKPLFTFIDNYIPHHQFFTSKDIAIAFNEQLHDKIECIESLYTIITKYLKNPLNIDKVIKITQIKYQSVLATKRHNDKESITDQLWITYFERIKEQNQCHICKTPCNTIISYNNTAIENKIHTIPCCSQRCRNHIKRKQITLIQDTLHDQISNYTCLINNLKGTISLLQKKKQC